MQVDGNERIVMPDQKPIRLLIRIYPDRDVELTKWYQHLPNRHGAKTNAAKELLRLGLAASKQDRHGSATCAELDAGALQQLEKTIQTIPAMDDLLPAIRQIVQSVVSSELTSIQVISDDQLPKPAHEESNSIEDALSAMEDELIDNNL